MEQNVNTQQTADAQQAANEEQPANTQQSANAQQPANLALSANTNQLSSLERMAVDFHLSLCLNLVTDEATAISTIEYVEKHKPGGGVHAEYLAHLGRYSKERLDFCKDTLKALKRARRRSVRQGILREDQQAPELAIVEDMCENNVKLWKKLKGLVEA